MLLWLLTFGSSMALVHGKGYCVWGVNTPFTDRFILLPPLGVAALNLGMFASAVTFFFTSLRQEVNSCREILISL